MHGQTNIEFKSSVLSDRKKEGTYTLHNDCYHSF